LCLTLITIITFLIPSHELDLTHFLMFKIHFTLLLSLSKFQLSLSFPPYLLFDTFECQQNSSSFFFSISLSQCSTFSFSQIKYFFPVLDSVLKGLATLSIRSLENFFNFSRTFKQIWVLNSLLLSLLLFSVELTFEC
jgi:hypothetical protein